MFALPPTPTLWVSVLPQFAYPYPLHAKDLLGPCPKKCTWHVCIYSMKAGVALSRGEMGKVKGNKIENGGNLEKDAQNTIYICTRMSRN